jgi:hypothetical protein
VDACGPDGNGDQAEVSSLTAERPLAIPIKA